MYVCIAKTNLVNQIEGALSSEQLDRFNRQMFIDSKLPKAPLSVIRTLRDACHHIIKDVSADLVFQ